MKFNKVIKNVILCPPRNSISQHNLRKATHTIKGRKRKKMLVVKNRGIIFFNQLQLMTAITPNLSEPCCDTPGTGLGASVGGNLSSASQTVLYCKVSN